MNGTTIFSDFLKELQVPHTGEYSDRQFNTMPFKSLFGFSRLLNSYGIESEAFNLSDKSQITKIPVPYIARLKDSFVIVTDINNTDGESIVRYISFHKPASMTLDKFTDNFSGIYLSAYPSKESAEPDFGKHRFMHIAGITKNVILIAAAIFLFVYGFVEARLYREISTIFLTVVDLCGLYITWLLILKSLRVKSHAADRVCGVLQQHGCDTVLEQKASKFFGLFGWSEVGLAYFSITTLIMLLFPQLINYLALINGCCLPFTIWSIWYQKFKIKTWCTLCVTTQCLLWLQFFGYLSGGYWHDILPLSISIIPMGAAYITALLAINKVMTFIETRRQES